MLHAADEMSAIRQTEKGRHGPVDGLLDIFMKGCAAENCEEHLMTDFMLRQLGLEPCEDTLVGNDWFRGISGGQRKRMSAGVHCRAAACQGSKAPCALHCHSAWPPCCETHPQGVNTLCSAMHLPPSPAWLPLPCLA